MITFFKVKSGPGQGTHAAHFPVTFTEHPCKDRRACRVDLGGLTEVFSQSCGVPSVLPWTRLWDWDLHCNEVAALQGSGPGGSVPVLSCSAQLCLASWRAVPRPQELLLPPLALFARVWEQGMGRGMASPAPSLA